MKKDKIDDTVLEKLDLNGSAILQHSEHTEWKERIIFAYAKAISLVAVVSLGMIILLICAFRVEDTGIIIHTITPVISGVLSFFAGRLKR